MFGVGGLGSRALRAVTQTKNVCTERFIVRLGAVTQVGKDLSVCDKTVTQIENVYNVEVGCARDRSNTRKRIALTIDHRTRSERFAFTLVRRNE